MKSKAENNQTTINPCTSQILLPHLIFFLENKQTNKQKLRAAQDDDEINGITFIYKKKVWQDPSALKIVDLSINL